MDRQVRREAKLVWSLTLDKPGSLHLELDCEMTLCLSNLSYPSQSLHYDAKSWNDWKERLEENGQI